MVDGVLRSIPVVSLDCGHQLSRICARDLVRSNGNKCPVCRAEIAAIDRGRITSASVQSGLAVEANETNDDEERQQVIDEVGFDGMALEFASEALRNDEEVVFAAVEENGLCVCFGGDAEQPDRRFRRCESEWTGSAFASEGVRNDRTVVLAAVNQNGLALQFASEGMRDDDDVVVAAVNVQNDWLCSLHRSFGNKDLILSTVAEWNALQFVSEELRTIGTSSSKLCKIMDWLCSLHRRRCGTIGTLSSKLCKIMD